MFTLPESDVTTVQAAGKKTSTPGTSPGSNVQSGISPGWSTIAAADAGAAGRRSSTAAATMRRMALARCLLTTAPPVGRVEHFYPNLSNAQEDKLRRSAFLNAYGILCAASTASVRRLIQGPSCRKLLACSHLRTRKDLSACSWATLGGRSVRPSVLLTRLTKDCGELGCMRASSLVQVGQPAVCCR